MSSKIGTLLSLIFVAMFVALGADMMSIQYLYSNLDAKSSAISYMIAKAGVVSQQLSDEIESKYKVTFICMENCNLTSPGAIIKYKISTSYKPIIILKDKMTISITRQAILSYYD